MNECRSEERRWCCFHPSELVVGICALCLNERLLVLASKQGHLHQSHNLSTATPRKSPIALTKIFAPTNLLNRLDVNHHKADDQYSHSSSSCPEDSFISIKFGDNGVASWDNGKIPKMLYDLECDTSMNSNREAKKNKSVVELSKSRAMLRWRRRIGHLFHLIRWKRSSKGNMCPVGTKVEGAKLKYGWVRTLTKRRTKD